MPIKKGLNKKTTNKTKGSVAKKVPLIKKKQTKAKGLAPVYILTQKLPREKCCTDVKKTGEAYSIPLGFSDRLGTTRLGSMPIQAPLQVPLQPPLQVPLQPQMIRPVPKVKRSVMRIAPKPKVNNYYTNVPLQRSILRLQPTEPNVELLSSEVVKGQEVFMGIPVVSKKNPITNYFSKKSDTIPIISEKKRESKVKNPKPKENIVIVDDEDEFNDIVATPLPQPKQKRTYTKRKETPRRNSIEDLNIRYNYYVGEPYQGNPMKTSDFKKLVEDMESGVAR